MQQSGFAFIDPVVVEEVSLPLWRELFEAIGWPASLSGKREAFTYDDIHAALDRDTLSDELLLALETFHDLGTVAGREAIAAILTERQISADTLPQGLGERDLAVWFFLKQRNDDALAEVCARAQIQIQEGNHHKFNDFVGASPKPIKGLNEKARTLQNAILEFSKANDLGDHVQIKSFQDDDGACCFRIMRSHHMMSPLAVSPTNSALRGKLQFRPVHADLLRYEPSTALLRITARARSIVPFYQQVFGRVCFGDSSFFEGNAVCSLKVLQDRGRAALANHGVFRVGRIWMTEVIWQRGDRRKLNVSDIDCFEAIEALKLPLSEGKLLHAKFKVEVIGKSARPVIVTVRVPSRIEVSQGRHQQLINDLLEKIGIRGTQVKSSDQNLWRLYPWRHPESLWREYLGKHTDPFVKKKVLVTTQLASIESAAHPGAGNVFRVEPISATEFLGVSNAPEIPSRSLSATDIAGLELSVPAFQNQLRELLGISANVTPWLDDSWYLDLGVLDVHDQQFRVVYALRQPPTDAAVKVRELSKSLRPVLLLPTGLKDSTGLAEVVLDSALPQRERVIKDIVAAYNLIVPAILTAPPGARLVVDDRLGKIWFDGVEISTITAGTQASRFVGILARNPYSAIDKYALSEQLSPARKGEDYPARAAKADVKKAIQAAFEARGLECGDDPIKAENGGYRLTVPAHIQEA